MIAKAWTIGAFLIAVAVGFSLVMALYRLRLSTASSLMLSAACGLVTAVISYWMLRQAEKRKRNGSADRSS